MTLPRATSNPTCAAVSALCLLVMVAAAVGFGGCSADDGSAASGSVELVVDGLGDDAGPVTDAERDCLRRRLEVNPMLTSELRDARRLDELDALTQTRVYEVAAPCVPTPLGRALLRAFAAATDVESRLAFVGGTQYRCFGRDAAAGKWLVDMRYATQGIVMTGDEMRSIATAFYLCARDYVVNGPLAQSLDVNRETAACVGTRLETSSLATIPEVARIMFGEGERERSGPLEQIISSCRG